MKTLMVIDGNSMMFRAFYATYMTNLMKTSTGIYTNAVYTFINMMDKVIKEYNPTSIYVGFDKGKKTLRHQEYQDYKVGRRKMPEEFRGQIPLCKKYLDIMNIPHLELDDYEADDIVGTIAVREHQFYDKVIVISGDKDLLQLVKDNIVVGLYKKGGEIFEHTTDNFYDIMGFNPDQLIDYKGIAGDTSDNLPGIKGIGEKGAINLLKKYQTIENVIAHANELAAKQQEAILTHKDEGLASKKLATIITDANFDYEITNYDFNNINISELKDFYTTLEFKSLLKSLDKYQISEIKEALKIEKVELNDLIKQIKDAKKVFMEVEIDHENYHKGHIIGISLGVNSCFAFVKVEEINLIKDILEDRIIEKYLIDSKKAYVSLSKVGINLVNVKYDLKIAAYVINPKYGTLDIKEFISQYIDYSLEAEENIYGKKDLVNLDNIDAIIDYSLKKIYLMEKIYLDTLSDIHNMDLDYLFNDVELKLALTLAKMELTGFNVSIDRINELGQIFSEKIETIEKQIFELAHHEFNIASPKQLGVVIFEELKLAKGKKNKTGYSTNAQILENLAKEHELPRLVLEYRKYAKLVSTYVNSLLDEVAEDGKIHTTFKQTLTLTGRLSSVEPNIQNIPVRNEEGRLIRSAFIPTEKNGLIISADYSQIELRILAHLANCELMINQINLGLDFHTATASNIFKVAIDEVTKTQRRMAKAVNFGVVYGISAYGLSEDLQISQGEAAMFIDQYFLTYPQIKFFMDKTVSDCQKLGYTKTLFNRRRYIPEINETNFMIRELGKRTAMNAPVQGSAADVMKIAMNRVDMMLSEKHLKSKMIAQIHDEIIIDCVKEEEEIVKEILEEALTKAVELKVKLDIDIETGSSWDLK